MVYIRPVITASGATAVQVVHYVRGAVEVRHHVGSAHTEAELGLLYAKARGLVEVAGQSMFDFEVDTSVTVKPLLRVADRGALFERPLAKADVVEVPRRVAPARVVGTASTVLYDALAAVFDQLGFGVLSDVVFRDMVIARIVEPTSMMACGLVLKDLGVKPASYSTMKRTLERIGEGQYRDQLATACFERVMSSGDASLVLYERHDAVFRG